MGDDDLAIIPMGGARSDDSNYALNRRGDDLERRRALNLLQIQVGRRLNDTDGSVLGRAETGGWPDTFGSVVKQITQPAETDG
jgi:hypothetical protein